MELKNKVLAGGALCGTLALDAEYAKTADKVLTASKIDEVVAGLGKFFAGKSAGTYDLAANAEERTFCSCCGFEKYAERSLGKNESGRLCNGKCLLHCRG